MPLLGDSHDIAPEIDTLPDPQAFGVADKGLPPAQIDTLVQGGPDFGVAPCALQLRRDDACVVENQAIAFAKQVGQVAHDMVGQALLPVDMQHPRGIARCDRSKSDPLGR